jgi:hypothetical protein
MGNRSLYIVTGDVLTVTGVMSVEGLDMLAVVDLLLVTFGWMDAWELNPELGSLWLKAAATLERITSAEDLHDRA